MSGQFEFQFSFIQKAKGCFSFAFLEDEPTLMDLRFGCQLRRSCSFTYDSCRSDVEKSIGVLSLLAMDAAFPEVRQEK